VNDQTLPYRYLNIFTNPLVTDWTRYIDNPEKIFLHIDQGGNYLLPEVKEFFLDLGLVPKRGNLWSRDPFNVPPYHTDQKQDCELFAINWLLSGESGITEWSIKALKYKIEQNQQPLLDKTDPQFWGDPVMVPDFSAVLDRPMMIRTDIPHRVNTLKNSTWRISYSLRFEDNPSWEAGLEKLKNYIIQ
jgi:hypothetical protein